MVQITDDTGQHLGWARNVIELAGTGPEPDPLGCAACGRRIGEFSRHWITAGDLRVICRRCGGGGTVRNCTATLNHLLVYPGCDVAGHDIHSHPMIWSGSAADTRRWLAGSRRARFAGNLGVMTGP